MNYVGKFDAMLSDGLGSHPHAQLHVDTVSATHAPSDAIIVPDAHLLFNGDFKRTGVDLVLSGDDRELVLHDYFKGEKRVALASPDGAHLTGDIVDALTGHVQVAQADGSASVSHVIGHVTKLGGTATAIRNGVSIILNAGDNVEKGDVVQSGSNSTLGITFIDGSVFGLASNARMVLNEMVYDPNGSSNSSLISLVAGTISFVAGETAKHGDMKVDTPVATMGIRGTAVLAEIDFSVPGQNGAPDAKFQVLLEPDGTTGNVVLFDKITLAPIATVNQAGQVLAFSNGNFSVTNAPLTPDMQKLIIDVFNQKFTDNTNTKSTDTQHSDISVPQTLAPIKLADGTTAVAKVVLVTSTSESSGGGTNGTNTTQHIDGPPISKAFGNAFTELVGKTGDAADFDTASGKVNYIDINAADVPTVQTQKDASGKDIVSFTYQDAHHNDVTASLTAQQLADIAAVEVKLSWAQDPAGKNNGSATWTYSVADNAFDFLAVGETLTLTYTAEIDNNFAPNPEHSLAPFTITITGTNDIPVITSAAPTIAFEGGTTVSGGILPLLNPDPATGVKDATSGTLSFTDVDLTDTHKVSTALTGAVWTLNANPNGTPVLSGVDKLPIGPFGLLNTALTASIAQDSDVTGSGTGVGTVNWKLADLPVYIADFIPVGETLTLTYTVTLGDLPQGAASGAPYLSTTTQTVTVTITGTDTPAVVWIATTASAASDTLAGIAPGDWNVGSHWETGNVPTANDDAIIITNQLLPPQQPPYYPVTIGAAASAKTVTMNDFSDLGNAHPTLINNSSLTVVDTFNLGADSVFNNVGTTTVGGAMEVSNTSRLTNSGTLKLNGGGDFKDSSTVSNTGTVEIAGGTLNVLVDVANSGLVSAVVVPGSFVVDAHTTLALNGGTIDGGTVTNHANGTIDLAGTGVLKNGALGNSGQINVSGTGNALDHETVTNTGAGAIGVTGTLTLDLGTSIIGGTLTNFGTVEIETSSGATLDNVTVHNESGVILVDIIALPVASTLVVDNGTSIIGGTITVGPAGTLEVRTASGATLSGVTVGNSNIVVVDDGSKLNLSGTEIIGGTINDFSALGGLIDVTGASKIDGGAALNGGAVTVDAHLTLDTVTVSGTDITDKSSIVLGHNVKLTGGAIIQGASSSAKGPITNNGTLEISGAATLLDDTLTNATTGSIIQIDDGATLTLSDAIISGGTVNDGTTLGTGSIAVTGSSKISGASLNKGGVTIATGQTLTLDNDAITGTTITGVDATSIVKIDDGTTLTLSGVTIIGGTLNDFSSSAGGTIHVTGASKIDGGAALNNGAVTVDAVLTLDTVTVSGTTITDNAGVATNNNVKLTGGAIIQGGSAKGPITNNGTLEISGSASLLNDTLTNNGIVKIDDSQTLTLSGTEIIGGTVNDFSSTTGGTIHVTGASKIDGGATLNNGAVTVDAVLTLDTVTVSGTTITDNAGVTTNNNVKLTGGAIIQGASSSAKGPVTNNGTLEALGTASLLNDTLTNNGIVKIDDSQTLTLSGTEIIGGTVNDFSSSAGGTIHVTGASKIDGGATLNNGAVTVDAVLTLDTVTVSGTDITDNAGVTTNNNVKLTGGAIIQGGSAKGPVTNNGTLEISGAASLLNDTLTNNGIVKIDDSQTLTLSGTEIIGGTVNDFSSTLGGTIHVTGASKIDGGATLNNGGVTVDAVLTLDTVTVSGTTLTDNAGIATNNNVKLTGGATIQGGSAKGPITNNGTLEALGSASLLNDTLTNNGIVKVDDSQTLTLSGTEIIGGTVNDFSSSAGGTIHVTGASKIDGGATLNNGAVTVDAVLTLDTVTVSGTTLTDNAGITTNNNVKLTGSAIIQGASSLAKGPVTNNGTLEISGSASLLNDTLTNNGIVKIDDSQTLTLSGTEIIGGTVNDFSSSAGGTIHVTGASKIDGGAALNNGAVTVDAVLTLDTVTVSGTTITDNAGITTNNNVKLTGGAIIQGGSAKGPITNNGTLEISGPATLLNDTLTNAATGSIIQIDDSQTLTLSGTEIIGGTVNDFSSSAGGTIHVTGASKIDGGAALNNGAVTVDAVLTLDTVTVSGTTITDNAGVTTNNNVKLTGSAIIQGGSAKGPVTNNGTLEALGSASLLNDTLTNNGIVKVDDSQTLTLSGTEIIGGTVNDFSSALGGTIHVTGASKIDGGAALNNGAVTVDAVLTLDTVTVSGTTITDNAGVTTNNNVKLTGGATIQGASSLAKGAITNNGTLEISGSASLLNDTLTNNGIVKIDDSQTLTLSGTEVIGGTVNDFSSTLGGTIHVTGASKIDGGAALNNGAVTVDAVLTLDTVTVSGTTINDNAGIVLDNNVTLKGSATIQGASSLAKGAVTNNGTLEISGAASLLNDTLTDATTGSIIQIDDSQTLTLSGTEIIGGTITDGATLGTGTIHVTGASEIDGGAALNKGTVTADAVLTLDTVTVSGTTINDNAGLVLDNNVTLKGSAIIQGTSSLAKGAITNNGTLEISGPATLLNDILTNAATGSIIQIDDSQTLTLSGTGISGGTINDGTVLGTGSIAVTGSSKISGASLNKGGVTIAAGQTLKLDNVTVTGTAFADPGTIKVDGGNTLTLAGTDSISGGQFAIGEGRLTQAVGSTVLLAGVAIGNLVAGNPTLTLKISSNGGGPLVLSSMSGLMLVGGLDGTGGTIEVAGTLSALNAALAIGLIYSPVGSSSSLTMNLDDGAGDTAFRTLTLTTPGASPSFIVSDASGAIRNAGLIDITGTTTLSSDAVFSGSAPLTVEAGAVLKLIHTGTHGAAITDKGTIEIAGTSGLNGGSLNIIGPAGVLLVDAGNGLKLNNITVTGGTVTDHGSIEITTSSAINAATLSSGGVTVDANQTLTLDGTVVNGTVFTDTASGATLSIDGSDMLTLQNAAVVTGGTIDNAGTLQIETVSGATLDGVNVVNTSSGIIRVDTAINTPPPPSLPVMLVLKDGTTITQGTLSIGNSGEVDIVSGSTATLTAVTVLNGDSPVTNGLVQVDGTLQLVDGTTVTGGTLAIGANGEVYVQNGVDSSTGATLDGVTVKISNGGELGIGGVVTSGSTLVLDDGTKISGGTMTFEGTGDLVLVNGTASLDSTTVGGPGTLQVGDGATLAIDGTVMLAGTTISGGTIDDIGTLSVSVSSEIENATVNGGGNLTVVTGQVLTLDAVTLDNVTLSGGVANSSTLTIDGPDKLTLNGATINGGTIADNGTIEVKANSSINGTGTPPLTTNAILNNGEVTVDTGVVLTLDNVTVNGTTFADTVTAGKLSVDLNDTLTLQNAVIVNGGRLDNAGTVFIETTAGAALNGVEVVNTSDGIIQVDTSQAPPPPAHSPSLMTLTLGDGTSITHGTLSIGDIGKVAIADGATALLDGVTVIGVDATTGYTPTPASLIEVGVTGAATLQLNDDTTISNGGLTIRSGSTLDIEAGASGHGATLDGVSVTGTGVEPASLIEVGASSVATLLLDDGTAIINGMLTIGSGSALDVETGAGGTGATLDGVIVTGTDAVIVGNAAPASTIEVGVTSTATLLLDDGTTIANGTLTIGDGSTLDVESGANGQGATLDGVSVTNGGTIEVGESTSGAILYLDHDTTITGGTLSTSNGGLIEILSNATLKIAGSVSGSGSIQIDGGALFELNGSDSQNISFMGTGGELQIDGTGATGHTLSLGSNLVGLAASDELDLRTISYGLNTTTGTYVGDASGGTLTITDGTNSISLNLVGNYLGAHFMGATDHNGGTLITLNASDDAPTIATTSDAFAELPGTGNATSDHAGGTITFTDVDLADKQTVTALFASYSYVAADGETPLLLSAGQESAVEAALTLTPPTHANSGVANWSYDVADSNFDFLAQNETLTLTYNATVSDGQGGTVSQPLTVTITGTNDAPTIASFVAGTLTDTAAADTFQTITGALVGHDVDDGESASLTYAALDATNQPVTTVAGLYGSLTVNDDGSYSYVPDDTKINALPAGSFTDQFTVQTTDVHGATGTATLTVDVTGTDDAPITVDQANAITGNTGNVSGQLLANDTDAENDTLSVSAVVGAADGGTTFTVDGTYGELVVNKTSGIYTYTLGATTAEATAVASLAQGVTQQDHFEYTVSDGTLGTDSHLTVGVTGINDAPTLAPVAAGTLTDTSAADTFPTISGELLGHDVDNGETALLTYAALSDGIAVNTGITGQYGTLTVNSDGSYSYVPNATAINALPVGSFTDQFTVQTTDVHGATGSTTLTVDITGADDAPITVDQANAITGNTGNVSGQLLANDTDAESDTLSVSAVAGGVAGSTTFTVDGTYGELVVNKATGIYTYTLGATTAEATAVASLAQGVTQQDHFTYTVSDGTLGTDSHLTVGVTGINDAPTLAPVVAGTLTDTATADTFPTISGELLGNDVDNGETASLTYAALDATNQPVTTVAGLYGSLTVNSDGSYSYVPNATAINALPAGSFTDQFTVQTTDVHGATGSTTLTVDITGADDAPITVDQANAITGNTGNVSGQLLANDTDAESDTLSVSAVAGGVAGSTTFTVDGTYGELVVNKATGIYTYTLGATTAEASAVAGLAGGVTQQDHFTYTVSDGTLGTDSHLTVGVTGINDAPVASAPTTPYAATALANLSLQNTGLSVSDVDGGSSTETATLSVGEGTIAVSAGNSGVTNIIGNNSGSVTFSGTIAQIDALLGSSTGTVVYNDNATPPSASTTLTLAINDNASGGALSGSASSTINVAPLTPVYLVTSTADTTDAGTLRSAIAYANTHAGTVITFSNTIANSTITLTSELPLIEGDGTVIDGGTNHITVSGNNHYRVFFVGDTASTIGATIENLTLAQGVAQGGSGAGGGGGGAGFGGAIFVSNHASLSLINASLTSDSAIGGNGGAAPADAGGGGGGMGGNGAAGGAPGTDDGGGGGGGFGVGANGGGVVTSGSAGDFTGGASGGSVPNGGAGGANGGGGGGGPHYVNGFSLAGGAGGGVGGGAPQPYADTRAPGYLLEGGNGGFGGGGGGAEPAGAPPGGNGGYGGGGGSVNSSGGVGGNGGFGGGGSIDGFGGFGGGNGASSPSGSGGGGAGAGGGVFVQGGGSLTVGGTLSVNGDSVSGGAGASTGSAFGGAIFYQGTDGHTSTLGFGAGTQSVSNAIADYTGSGGTDPSSGANVADQGGSVALVKTGGGTLTLSGVNTYTGSTTVAGSTLEIDGSIAKSAVTVQSGGVLDGIGTTGAVTVLSGGTLAAGDGGAGLLATGNLSLQSGSTFAVELGGTTAGTGYDQVDVTGTVALNGAILSTTLINSFAGKSGTFEIINNDGADAVSGTFAGLAEGATVAVGGQSYAISYVGGDGNDVTLTAQGPLVDVHAAAISTTATVNFDGLDASSGGVAGSAFNNYLAGFGITLTSSSGGVASVDDDRQIYGGGIVEATTGHNVVLENGPYPLSYTVTFDHPLTSFEFDRVQENAGPSGSSYTGWTATAYDATGHVLSTVTEGGHVVYGNPLPAVQFTLTGGDIDHVTFADNYPNSDGFANAVTDSWTLNGTSAAPAASDGTPVTITGIAVSDAAAGTHPIDVSLAVGDGTLSLVDAADLSVSFDTQHDTLTMSGSVADIDAVLAKGVVYTPTSGFNGNDTLTVTANDEGNNATGSPLTNVQTLNIPVTHAITGTAGNDTLTGTAANDTFTGGGGSDQFVFNASVNGTGHDTITDFAPGQDQISLNYSSLPGDTNNFSTWLASHATATGHDVLIDLNADNAHPNVDTILLKNVTLASLHAGDFHFLTSGLA